MSQVTTVSNVTNGGGGGRGGQLSKKNKFKTKLYQRPGLYRFTISHVFYYVAINLKKIKKNIKLYLVCFFFFPFPVTRYFRARSNRIPLLPFSKAHLPLRLLRFIFSILNLLSVSKWVHSYPMIMHMNYLCERVRLCIYIHTSFQI